MNVAKALAWNTGVQIAGKVVSTAIGAIVVGLMTRHLGQAGFGMYSTANAYFQVFAIMLDLGITVMLIQLLGEHAGDHAYERRAVSATFTFRGILAFVVLTIAAVIGIALPYPHELKVAFFAIWGSFFMSALNQIVVGVHQQHFTMHLVAIGEIVGRLTILVGVLFAIANGWGLVPIVSIISVGSAMNFCVIAFTARRYAALHWNWDPAFWKELLRRSWPVGLSILFNLVYFKADTLILSTSRPFTEVGLYGAAYRVLEILITIPFMYTGVLLPLLAQAWASKDLERFRSLYRNSLVAMAILAAPLLGGVAVLGRQMLTLVAGKEFTVSGDVLKILMIAAVIIFLGTVTSHAIIALDIQRAMLPIYIVIAVATLTGYIVFIPRYGMWAAAWLTVAAEACVACGSAFLSLRRSGTRLFAMPYLKTALAALLMALAIYPMKHVWLPVPILAGAAIYSVLIIALGVISRETLRDLFTFRKETGTIPPI